MGEDKGLGSIGTQASDFLDLQHKVDGTMWKMLDAFNYKSPKSPEVLKSLVA